MPNLWDRQPSDTKRSYEAFMDYARMGAGRSLRKLVEIYVKQAASNPQAPPPTTHRPTIWGWSKRHEWQTRVNAWDDYQAQLAAVEYQDYIQKKREQRIAIADRLIVKSLEYLQNMDPDTATLRDVVAMLKLAFESQRLEFGEATTRPEGDINNQVVIVKVVGADMDAI